MRETEKSLIAASVSGVAGAALFAVYVAADGGYALTSIAGDFLASLIPFQLVAFLLGWPTYVVASSRGRARWWWAVIAGMGFGSAFGWLAGAGAAVTLPAIGAVAGGAFWMTLSRL